MQKCHKVLQNIFLLHKYKYSPGTSTEDVKGVLGSQVPELLRGYDTQKLGLRNRVWLVSTERFSSHCPLPTSASTSRT